MMCITQWWINSKDSINGHHHQYYHCNFSFCKQCLNLQTQPALRTASIPNILLHLFVHSFKKQLSTYMYLVVLSARETKINLIWSNEKLTTSQRDKSQQTMAMESEQDSKRGKHRRGHSERRVTATVGGRGIRSREEQSWTIPGPATISGKTTEVGAESNLITRTCDLRAGEKGNQFS